MIAILFLVYIGVFTKNFKTSSLLDFSKPPVSQTSEDIPPGLVRAPTPYLVLPTGRQEYLVSSSPEELSTITKIIVNPLDASKDQEQVITVDASSKQPITSINVEYETDNGKTLIPFGLVDGTNQSGTWNAKWKLTDTNDKNYHLVFKIKTSTKETTVDFPVR